MAQLLAGTDLLVVPSFNADPRTLACIDGLNSWAERHLVELRHLLDPGNRLVFITPTPISEGCLEAVLKLMPAWPLYTSDSADDLTRVQLICSRSRYQHILHIN